MVDAARHKLCVTPSGASTTIPTISRSAAAGRLREENADIRRRLLDGELLPNVAAVAVQSINTDIRAVGAALKAREQEELLERLEALEQSREGGRRRWG